MKNNKTWTQKKKPKSELNKTLKTPVLEGESEIQPTDEDCINAVKKQLNENGFKTN